jgi:Tfp pilus assembly protein PilF
MAQICEKLGKREEAKKYYRESVKYKPSYYVALNNLGALYASEKNWDSALHQFELAYRADAGIEMTLTNLMVVHFNKGQFERVVRFGEEALKLGYNNQKVMNLLQEARRREGFIP